MPCARAAGRSRLCRWEGEGDGAPTGKPPDRLSQIRQPLKHLGERRNLARRVAAGAAKLVADPSNRARIRNGHRRDPYAAENVCCGAATTAVQMISRPMWVFAAARPAFALLSRLSCRVQIPGKSSCISTGA